MYNGVQSVNTLVKIEVHIMATTFDESCYRYKRNCVKRDPTEEEKAALEYPKDKFDLISVDCVYEWDQPHKYNTKEGLKVWYMRQKSVWITVKCKKCGTVKHVADNKRMGCKQGPCHQRFVDWTGKRVNRLTALRYVHTSYVRGKAPAWYWECRCDCGKLTLCKESQLVMGTKVECQDCARKRTADKVRLPDNMSAWHRIIRTYKKGAKDRGLSYDLTFDQAYDMMKNGVCHYCGAAPAMTSYGVVALGIDRLDNGKGYTVDNCVSCCKWCNIMKGQASEPAFLQHVLAIARNKNLTFNDYPVREYTEAGGNGERPEKGEDIV